MNSCKTCGNTKNLFIVTLNPSLPMMAIKCSACKTITTDDNAWKFNQSRPELDINVIKNHHENGRSSKIYTVSNTLEEIFMAIEKEHGFNKSQRHIGMYDNIGTYAYINDMGDPILDFTMIVPESPVR